jgi:acetyltransferase
VGGHLDDFVPTGAGLVALTAKLRVRAWDRAEPHLALPPYPASAEALITLRDGRQALIRPLRPTQDLPWLQSLIDAVSQDDRFMRFARVLHDPTLELARMLRVDYDREMVFIALCTQPDGSTQALGVVEAQILPDGRRAEFSILLRSDQKRTGLGRQLMHTIIEYARQRELRELFGEVLKGNRPMRGLATRLGFETRTDFDDDLVTVSLDLSRHDTEPSRETPKT